MDVKPLKCIRPGSNDSAFVSTPPVDVFSDAEVIDELHSNPRTYLHLDSAAMVFPGTEDWRPEDGIPKAQELLAQLLSDGTMIEDDEPAYYLYRMVVDGVRSQTGVMGAASIFDGRDGRIKKHESTRVDKEDGCIRHIHACDMHTAPVFLAYRSEETNLSQVIHELSSSCEPLYDFLIPNVRNTVWKITDPDDNERIRLALEGLTSLYVADGHHRLAASIRAGFAEREKLDAGEDDVLPSDYFLAAIFPSDELMVHPYNRSVADLNGLDEEEFLAAVGESFAVEGPFEGRYEPERKGRIGMFLKGRWYAIEAKEKGSTLIEGLDVSVLQERLLDPILGITDPRKDPRLDFVRGTRGVEELEQRRIGGKAAAVSFRLFPTDIYDLLQVADDGQLMPPKSTWFSPKPRSGLFFYRV